MGNNLQVKISADVVDLQQKFATARAETSALGAEMGKLAKQSAAGTLDTAGQSQFAQLAQDYLQAKTSAASYSAQIRESTNANRGFGESIENARAKMSTLFQVTGAAAAYEAVSRVVQIVTELGNRALDIRNMSDVLQITTAQFQAMSAAADEAGVSDQALMIANERLKTTLNEAREQSGPAIAKLVELGITTAQIADKSFGLNQALGVISGRLRDGATNAQEMAAATQLLGGRAAHVAEAWKVYDGSAAAVAATIARLNGFTDEQTKELAENAIKIKEMGTEAANTGSKLLLFAEDMVKMETKVAQVVGSFSAQSVVLRAAMATMGESNTTANPAAAKVAQVQAATEEVIISAKRQTVATLSAEQTQVQAIASGTAQRVALARKYYEDTLAFYGNAAVPEVRAAQNEMLSAQREFTSSHLALLREEASAAKEKYREDLAAYRESLTQMKEASKEFETIDRQNAAADIQIQRDAVAAKKSLLQASIGDNANAAAAKFATMRSLVNQEYDLDQQALQNELKGLEDEPAAYNRVYNEIRELKARQVAELAALDQQQAQASRRAAQQDSQAWKDGVREIESAESTLIGDLVSRRKSLGQSLVSVSASFLQQELANDAKAFTIRLLTADKEEAAKKALAQGGLLYHQIVEMGKTNDTAAQEAARTAAAQTAAATRNATTASAAAAQQSITAAIGSQTVMADAAKAFAGTYASVAQIPYVGWVMAPGAAAAAFAEVSSMAGMASLDVGAYNVRQDMPANIHAGEAVLSKPEARAWRQQVESGSAGGGDVHFHQNFSGIDGMSMKRMAQSNEFMSALMTAARAHFSRGGR